VPGICQAVEVQPGEVWLDGLGRTLAIIRFEQGRTVFTINGGREVRMRSHIFAWSLAKNSGRLLTLAPLTTY
jgi:hypothetical protein